MTGVQTCALPISESCGLPVFFSAEITKEASACELGHFIELGEPAGVWADEILKAAKENMPKRRSYAGEVADAGFDSASEALRIQRYYIKALKIVKEFATDG